MWRTVRWLLVALATSGTALAQGAPSPWTPEAAIDTLTLADGTVLRGRVAELRPLQSVTIVLLSGEARTLQWSGLAAAQGPGLGAHALGPAPATPPAAAAAPPPPPAPPEVDARLAAYRRPAPGRVAVSVVSVGREQPLGVVLGRLAYAALPAASEPMHHDLCTTPCTLWVPPGRLYLHAGGGPVVATVTELFVPRDGLRVELNGPSATDLAFASVFASVGSTLLGAGAGLALATLLFLPTLPTATEFLVGSAVTAGLGLVIMAPGLVLAGRNPIGVRSITAGGRRAREPARP